MRSSVKRGFGSKKKPDINVRLLNFEFEIPHERDPAGRDFEFLINRSHNAAPADFIEQIRIVVEAKPYKYGFTYNVILRHKTPVTAIQ